MEPTEPTKKLAFVRIGARVTALTPDALPPANTRRWVARRKATVVAAVRANVISLEEALNRYSLTVEEFRSWEKAIDEHGLRGLRATRAGNARGPKKRGRKPARGHPTDRG